MPRGESPAASPRGAALPQSPFPLRWSFLLKSPIRYALVNRARTFAECGIHAGDTALELGAGSGFWTGALATHLGSTGRLYAQDVQPAMLARVESSLGRHPLRTIVTPLLCSSESIPLPDASLDAVFAAYVLEEVDRERLMPETAAELARLVRAGGTLGVREHRWGVSVGRMRAIFAALTAAGFHCDSVATSRFSYAARFTRRVTDASGAAQNPPS